MSSFPLWAAIAATCLLLSACNQAAEPPNLSFEGKIPVDGALIYRN